MLSEHFENKIKQFEFRLYLGMFLFFFHLMLFDSFGKLLVEEGALVLLEREPHYFVLVNLLRERLFFSLLLKFLHQLVHQLLSRRHVGRPLRTADENAIITEHIVELVIVVA